MKGGSYFELVDQQLRQIQRTHRQLGTQLFKEGSVYDAKVIRDLSHQNSNQGR
jgi:hypothetical protein